MKRHLITAVVSAVLMLCIVVLYHSYTTSPIHVGFIAGLSGKASELGVPARNGALLAVKLWNEKGGIAGRKIELVVEDDEQTPEKAKIAVEKLINEDIIGIVGPTTSAMAIETAKVTNLNKVVLLSPTTSTNALTGHDDYFFRVYPASSHAASALAEAIHQKLKRNRVAVVYDIGNLAHTQSWLSSFRQSFLSYSGAEIPVVLEINSKNVRYFPVVEQLKDVPFDAVFLLANSIDTAMLSQHLRRNGRTETIVTSEWSATNDIITNGGTSVEGVLFFNTFNRMSTDPDYENFHKRYIAEYNSEPGFAAVHSFDATNIMLTAYADAKGEKDLKTALLERKSYKTLQGEIHFDRNGDVVRDHYLMTIQGGAFTPFEK